MTGGGRTAFRALSVLVGLGIVVYGVLTGTTVWGDTDRGIRVVYGLIIVLLGLLVIGSGLPRQHRRRVTLVLAGLYLVGVVLGAVWVVTEDDSKVGPSTSPVVSPSAEAPR